MVIEGKRALITGGAKRLGRACALELARQGADILLHYKTSRKEAEETADDIRSLGRDVRLVQADLNVPEQAVKSLDSAMEEWKGRPVQILINSASIFPEGRWDTAGEEAFLENYRVNALAPLFLSRLVARKLTRWAEDSGESTSINPGAIVQFLDTRIAGRDPAHIPYHLSKRALFSFTRILSEELAPGILVNGIAPGVILPPEGADTAYLERMKKSNLLNRSGSVQEILNSMVFLIRSDFITGQILYVDGGRHLKENFYGL